MPINDTPFIKPKKPSIGDAVRDVAGNEYTVYGVGMKYLNVTKIGSNEVLLVPIGFVFPVPPEAPPEAPRTRQQTLDEEFGA